MVHEFALYLMAQLQKGNQDGGPEIPAAVLAVIARFLADSSVTLANIRQGDFGKVAQAAAEEFPFNADGSIRGDTMMGTSSRTAVGTKASH